MKKSITYSELINGLFLLYFAMEFILFIEISVASIIFFSTENDKSCQIKIDCEIRA